MMLKKFKSFKAKVLGNLVALQWFPINKIGKIYLPFQFHEHKDLKQGNACFGKVIAVGPQVKQLKKKDIIYFNEYEADNGMYLKTTQVYFIKENLIELKVLKLPENLVYRT